MVSDLGDHVPKVSLESSELLIKRGFLETWSLGVTYGLIVSPYSIYNIELQPSDIALHVPLLADLKP